MHYKPSIVSAYFVECGLPKPVFEHQHIPGRKFRLDVAWPEHKVGIEVQGGVWTRGKHGRGSGIVKDVEKRNLQLIHGWSVIEVQPSELCMQETVEMVKAVIGIRSGTITATHTDCPSCEAFNVENCTGKADGRAQDIAADIVKANRGKGNQHESKL